MYALPKLIQNSEITIFQKPFRSLLRTMSYQICFPGFKVLPTNLLTHFIPLIYFDTPWKHQKITDFLTFLGGIKRDQWHKMGKCIDINQVDLYDSLQKPSYYKWIKVDYESLIGGVSVITTTTQKSHCYL